MTRNVEAKMAKDNLVSMAISCIVRAAGQMKVLTIRELKMATVYITSQVLGYMRVDEA